MIRLETAGVRRTSRQRSAPAEGIRRRAAVDAPDSTGFRFVPVPGELDRCLLAVRGLPEGHYGVLADCRPPGSFAADRLATGVNISSAIANGWKPGGPRDAEAALLIRLTDARSEVATARRLAEVYLPGHFERHALHRQAQGASARLEDLQRTFVRLKPFHFIVRPAARKTS